MIKNNRLLKTLKGSFYFILLGVITILLYACDFNFGNNGVDKEIESIEVTGQTEFKCGEFSYESLTLTINHIGDTYINIKLDDSMISKEDLDKLNTVGLHEITVKYKGFSTLVTINITSTDGSFIVQYKVDDKIIETKEYTSEAILEKPNDPVKEGYVFEGWYLYLGEKNETIFDFNTSIKENTILYAKFTNLESKEYKVLFIANDICIDEITIKESEVVSPITNPYKEGYEFLGWSTILNDESTMYDFNNVVTNDITLYALFKALEYNVDFTMYGNIIQSFTYKYNEVVSINDLQESLNSLIKKNLLPNDVFLKWDIEDEIIIKSDLTINSIIETSIITYKITFYVEEEVFHEYTLEANQNITSPVDIPYKEGYTFDGWYLNDEKYVFGSEATSDMSLEGKFTQNIYKVTFSVNNETFTIKEIPFGELIDELNISTPEVIGFDFINWDYDFTLPVKNDLTINAVLKIKSFTVTYYDDELLLKTINVDFDQKITDDYIPEAKKDFTFAGWLIDKDNDSLYDFDKTITEDINLYAKWIKNLVSVDKVSEKLTSEGFNPVSYSNNLSFYEKYGFSGYSLTIGNNVVLVSNVVEIIDSNTDLIPNVKAGSCGTLYLNKTGGDFVVLLSTTKARNINGYNQIHGDSFGRVKKIITSYNNETSVTLKSDDYLWCPGYNDSVLGEGTNGLSVDLKGLTDIEQMHYTDWNGSFKVVFKTQFGDVLDEKVTTPFDELVYPTLVDIENYTFDKWDDTSYVFFSKEIKALYLSDGHSDYTINVVDGTGSGTYPANSLVTCTANVIKNYTFTHWTEFGKKVSTNKEYTFRAIDNTTLKAHYVETSTIINLQIGGKVIYDNAGLAITIPNNYVDQTTEMRAAWVSPITGCVSSFKTIDSYKKDINEMFDTLEYFNMNAVVFHIRIFNDALYLSDLNPKSTYLNTTWDALTWVIEECHKRGIEFHAWMNPYRVTNSGGSNLQTIADNIKAKCSKNIGANVKYLLSDGQKVILNPGYQEVRTFIVNTVMEVIQKYDVDAIHFDDYFYIENVNDDALRNANNPKGLSKEDWRRDQVDMFIEQLSKAMRDYNKKNNRFVELGISPSGMWQCGDGEVKYDANGNAITNGSHSRGMEHYGDYLFSDTVRWINEEWIDYITPQSYWAFTYKGANFSDVMSWWNKVVLHKNVKLYAGMGIYMADTKGNYSWNTNADELLQQVTFTTKLNNVSGFCLFKFEYLREYYKNIASTVFKNMFDTVLKNDWKTKALTPEKTSCNDKVTLGEVQNLKATITGNKVTITFDAIENARKYVVFRSDGELLYNSDEIVDILGTGNTTYTITDTLEYNSNFTYTVCAISASNTLGEETTIDILYK